VSRSRCFSSQPLHAFDRASLPQRPAQDSRRQETLVGTPQTCTLARTVRNFDSQIWIPRVSESVAVERFVCFAWASHGFDVYRSNIILFVARCWVPFLAARLSDQQRFGSTTALCYVVVSSSLSLFLLSLFTSSFFSWRRFVIVRMFDKFKKDKRDKKDDNSTELATTTNPSSPSSPSIATFPSGVSQDAARSEAGSLDSRRPRPVTHNSAFDDGFRYQTVCNPLLCS